VIIVSLLHTAVTIPNRNIPPEMDLGPFGRVFWMNWTNERTANTLVNEVSSVLVFHFERLPPFGTDHAGHDLRMNATLITGSSKRSN
jgi:hypothetical protein